MTSLAEAVSKFGQVVRSAGGEVFGIERTLGPASRPVEKLQIGTPDGFIKIAICLDQPDMDAVLRERTAVLVKHADQLRTPPRPTIATSASFPGHAAAKV